MDRRDNNFEVKLEPEHVLCYKVRDIICGTTVPDLVAALLLDLSRSRARTYQLILAWRITGAVWRHYHLQTGALPPGVSFCCLCYVLWRGASAG